MTGVLEGEAERDGRQRRERERKRKREREKRRRADSGRIRVLMNRILFVDDRRRSRTIFRPPFSPAELSAPSDPPEPTVTMFSRISPSPRSWKLFFGFSSPSYTRQQKKESEQKRIAGDQGESE
jgi:hypothetical protein